MEMKNNNMYYRDSGNLVMCVGLLGISVGIAASVWYPMKLFTENLDVLLQTYNIKDQLVYDNIKRPRDCADFKDGNKRSGVYRIYPNLIRRGIDVYCDQVTDDGGWMVFQRRVNGSVNFFESWNNYQIGFGNMDTEFWLGNEYLHTITKQGWYELLIVMSDFENETRYAKYKLFSVDNRDNEFQLTVVGYSGNAGDSFSNHNGRKFSTVDRDNDPMPGSCAATYKGGWWYSRCLTSCLNGQYLHGEHKSEADGINWQKWRGLYYSLKTATMMIRPI